MKSGLIVGHVLSGCNQAVVLEAPNLFQKDGQSDQNHLLSTLAR